MCQVARFAAASSTDAHSNCLFPLYPNDTLTLSFVSAPIVEVRAIRACVNLLEKLDPEVVPAALVCHKESHNKAALSHLRLLKAEWSSNVRAMVTALDDITDPKMFIHVSGKSIDVFFKGVNFPTCLTSDHKGHLGAIGWLVQFICDLVLNLFLMWLILWLIIIVTLSFERLISGSSHSNLSLYFFLEVEMRKDVVTCKESLNSDAAKVASATRALIGRGRRVVHVTTSIVDSCHDPMFRNALRVYVNKLNKGETIFCFDSVSSKQR